MAPPESGTLGPPMTASYRMRSVTLTASPGPVAATDSKPLHMASHYPLRAWGGQSAHVAPPAREQQQPGCALTLLSCPTGPFHSCVLSVPCETFVSCCPQPGALPSLALGAASYSPPAQPWLPELLALADMAPECPVSCYPDVQHWTQRTMTPPPCAALPASDLRKSLLARVIEAGSKHRKCLWSRQSHRQSWVPHVTD